MTDSRRIVTLMARQLYSDMRFVTQLNPVNIVDDETTSAFNTLLRESKRLFPGHPVFEGFSDMSARNIKYKDALIVVGQLASLLELLTQGEFRIDAAVQAGAARADGRPAAPGQASGEHDVELYGAGNKGVKRNPDGTIPFSLE